MTLTPADRQKLRDAFRQRIGNLSLPSDATIDTLCVNLVLAVPVLLEALDRADCGAREDARCERARTEKIYCTRCYSAQAQEEAESKRDAALADLREAEEEINALETQLEADPCP